MADEGERRERAAAVRRDGWCDAEASGSAASPLATCADDGERDDGERDAICTARGGGNGDADGGVVLELRADPLLFAALAAEAAEVEEERMGLQAGGGKAGGDGAVSSARPLGAEAEQGSERLRAAGSSQTRVPGTKGAKSRRAGKSERC